MATRYPKSGKGRQWTVAELKSVSAAWHGDSLSDGGGLNGDVRVASDGSVSIRWRVAYWWDSKTRWADCGTWPRDSLEAIRRRREQVRALVREGVEPKLRRKAEQVEARLKDEALIRAEEERRSSTLRAMYEAWLDHGVRRADGNAAIKSAFEIHVLPSIGDAEVVALEQKDLLEVLRTIASKGYNRTAVVVARDIGQMFRWAQERRPWRGLLVDGNPTHQLQPKLFVEAGYRADNIRRRYLRDEEVKELAYLYATVKPLKQTSELATWICLSTLTRIGETMAAEWRHVDFAARTWLIPASNVKGEEKNKKDLVVRLSDFSLRLLKSLHELTGKTRWLFPSDLPRKGEVDLTHLNDKTVTKQITDRQVQFTAREKPLRNRVQNNSLVLGGGEHGEWTPHDLRRTGATMMQALKVDPRIIDLCQNHSVQTRVQKAYQQHEHTEEMCEAWQALGSKLEALMAAVDSKLKAEGSPGLPAHLRDR